MSIVVLNGYYIIGNKSMARTKVNYGNIISGKLRDVSFDSLPYGLYKLKGDSIEKISDETNDIHLQKNGLFFVPPPGFDVIRKYLKSAVLNKIDSISKLSHYPARIYVEPS